MPASDYGSGPKKQEQNALNSTTGFILGRFRPVAFDVDGENYRVLSAALAFEPHTFFVFHVFVFYLHLVTEAEMPISIKTQRNYSNCELN